MIKNIVFDMGMVLLNYRSDAAVRAFSEDEVLIKKVNMAVFQSQEWLMLDMGIISEEKALARMLSRLDTEEEKKVAKLAFENWHKLNLFPKEGMAELIAELKARGCNCYILSNAAMRVPEYCMDMIPGNENMDGALFSAEEKCIKPQSVIYERFFERFGLVPKECFFIDDLMSNIEGARAAGMDGYCFEDGNVEKLRTVLNDII